MENDWNMYTMLVQRSYECRLAAQTSTRAVNSFPGESEKAGWLQSRMSETRLQGRNRVCKIESERGRMNEKTS